MAARSQRRVRLWRVPERPRPRLVLQDGERWLDLSELIGEAAEDLVGLLAADFFGAARLDAYLSEGVWREVAAPERVLTPLEPRQVGKVLALGKNVRAHAAEFGEEPPEEPMFFAKLPETLSAHGASVRVPHWYDGRFDHEAELAVVIGQGGSDIAPERALAHVAGYTLANDLTARTLQGRDRKQGHPWLRAKNFPGACPLGPCLVPRDHIDVADLRVTCRVQKAGVEAWETRQDWSTRDWIHDVPAALAWISRHLPLHPGDVVLMGTGEGVGPLEHGDTVVVAAEGIGELATTIERPG
ncbi:MAG TPA: fumarylacetoacetate hydrolase family protein [Planctomycetota bacterium]|nr:fumarylacetoacetate hydrolase family protein [Planctomycetota bacterium]